MTAAAGSRVGTPQVWWAPQAWIDGQCQASVRLVVGDDGERGAGAGRDRTETGG